MRRGRRFAPRRLRRCGRFDSGSPDWASRAPSFSPASKHVPKPESSPRPIAGPSARDGVRGALRRPDVRRRRRAVRRSGRRRRLDRDAEPVSLRAHHPRGGTREARDLHEADGAERRRMRADVRRGRAQRRAAPVRTDLEHEPRRPGDVERRPVGRARTAHRDRTRGSTPIGSSSRASPRSSTSRSAAASCTGTRRTSSTRCGCSAAATCAACARAVGRWMPERPCPGNFTAYLEFADGTPATIVYNGYGYFDTSELTWGIGNRMYSDRRTRRVRRALRGGVRRRRGGQGRDALRRGATAPVARSDGRESPRYDGRHARAHRLVRDDVASCERGDVRQSPNGLYVYDDIGPARNTGIRRSRYRHARDARDVRVPHRKERRSSTTDAGRSPRSKSGMAIMQSGRDRREIVLEHQCVNA